MVNLILLLTRKRGLSPAQFREYYETHHVPLGRRYLGHLFVDYRRYYVGAVHGVAEDGHTMVDRRETGHDAITVISLEDEQALAEFYRIASTPEVSRVLREDEERFLDRPAMTLNVCEEVKTWTAADLTAATP